MPILAGVTATPTTVQVVPDAHLSLDIEPVGGERLNFGDGTYVIRSGVLGLEVPPRRVEVDEILGLDGGRLARVSTGVREVSVPLLVAPWDDRTDSHLAARAALRRAMDYRSLDYVALEGTLDLVAARDGVERRLRCLYKDGMEGSLGYLHGHGSSWSTFDIGLIAVHPYWRGPEWSTPLIGVEETEPFLSTNDAHGWPRMLAPSVALGPDMPVIVTGDVSSAPVVDIIGPATTTTVTSPSGMSVTVGAIPAGESFRLDTRRRVSVTLGGIDAWGLLGAAPVWAPLGTGETTISVVSTGATSQTRVRVWGDSLWESPW